MMSYIDTNCNHDTYGNNMLQVFCYKE